MTVRFLVDECVIGPIVQALADAGHDLIRVAGLQAGLADLLVADMAQREARILLTQDYDFGELAVRHGVAVPGIVLIGCDGIPPRDRPLRVLEALGSLTEPFVGHLTIIEPNRVRRRPL